MHLAVAERICKNSRLQEAAGELLDRHFSAFYLGSVAPDYQWLKNLPRESTHFYGLPPETGNLGYPTMFSRFPELADSWRLSQEQAVFVAAYCAHLYLDLRWYHEVLMPYFVAPPEWDDNHQRFVVHNTLLTYLDKLAFQSLPERAEQTLADATPINWLPFAEDDDLILWRDMLAAQLRPGAPLRTIEIYAGRLYMSPEDFAANLEHPEWMEEHLFGRVPVDSVQGMITSAVSGSADLINEYLLMEH